MIEVNHPFKKYCYSSFGEEEGKKVLKFYNNFFSPSKYKRQGADIQLSTENKIKNIESILEKTTKNNFLSCIDKFINDDKFGIVKTHSIKYFTAAACNFKPKQEPIVSSEDTSVIPKIYKKVRNEYEDDFFNWDYSCSCTNIINPWQSHCPKCKSFLNWKEATI